MSVGGIAAEALRQGIERIERLEEEKAAISNDIKEVYTNLASQGFDKKTCRKVVVRRKLDPEARREEDALLELYEHAMGMADGGSLSDRTRDHLSKPKREPDFDFDGDQDEAGAEPAAGPQPAPDVSLDEARAMGRKAAEENKPVSSNPFPAGDPRRAAWDEEWCRAAGNDGMEIPEQFRRKKKPKKDKDPEKES